PSVTWNDIAWVRENWDGPLVVKGVLDPQDAHHAVDAGVDGIVVSNHGGRQLDAVPSTVRALPEVVDAVEDRVEVLVDGGIRSGLGVVKMLALGAKAVLIGRAWAWAVAARGEEGVHHMLDLIDLEAAEVERDPRAARLQPRLLRRPEIIEAPHALLAVRRFHELGLAVPERAPGEPVDIAVAQLLHVHADIPDIRDCHGHE